MANTPMMEQYLAIKENYQDAFLFYRLGDFYEMFYDDALLAVKELEITLTSRDGKSDNPIPMCGVPYHSADQYIRQLVDRGYKIAICEQIEDPKDAKGVVKREVIRLITPGTVMDGQALDPKSNNYIASVSICSDARFGFAVIDLSTGESRVTTIDDRFVLIQEILTSGAREIVIDPANDEDLPTEITASNNLTVSYESETATPERLQYLADQLSEEQHRLTYTRLLNYLNRTGGLALAHLQPPVPYTVDEFMTIDTNSKRNLELTSTIRENKKYGSLLWLLDHTMTAMGARKLKQWIEKPLIDQEVIHQRLDAVEAFINHFFERESVREALKQVYDLERVVGRVAYGNVNARELIQLKHSLQQIPEVVASLSQVASEYLQQLVSDIDDCHDVMTIIDQGIMEDPPPTITDGGMIQDGYNTQLDDYRYVSRNGKEWIAGLQKNEREATGIKSLKVGYNKVFGYYIEVTKPNLPLLPEGRYERKQTLTNAERFITPELKEKEKMIMEAEDHLIDLEYELFQDIREQVKAQSERLQKLAKTISTIDVLQSFAACSDQYDYVRPEFSRDHAVHLTDQRHPVVERVMDDGTFVANDVHMSDDDDILLITGPNMGGKSTFMRQTALAAVMAQMGCFVPASKAIIPVFDQIFTRIGAADDLVSGQSTFMVEMIEAQNAVRHATKNSLILLDEIGRGTSTYDGIAIAQAIVEYIHHHIGAKTLFSTHYHELTQLEGDLQRLKNVHVSAMENEGSVVFLHKVEEGYADKSYGIHVAQLAELPDELIQRATEILSELEHPEEKQAKTDGSYIQEQPEQLTFFVEPETAASQQSAVQEEDQSGKQVAALLSQVERLDLLNMTPMDAMNELYKIQKQLKRS
ncbi:DNA mismatch repair protein MutS [Tuberibacillus sp. Marseille-P3662]|uniref:DNA mismatch repair protein MutS n=1 Tax=Tuberibacillus sp. Marseille-P3662 TaxID=1965358 RepID=UPI000A1CE9FF|nr:DNA mismatch repair protein MutS [Tuberibacillus sp. Marseille-P3662]